MTEISPIEHCAIREWLRRNLDDEERIDSTDDWIDHVEGLSEIFHEALQSRASYGAFYKRIAKNKFDKVFGALDLITNPPDIVRAAIDLTHPSYVELIIAVEKFKDALIYATREPQKQSPTVWYIVEMAKQFGGITGTELTSYPGGQFFELVRILSRDAWRYDDALSRAIRRALEPAKRE